MENKNSEYFKDFDRWNIIKKDTNGEKNLPIFYEREVWHCRIGVNISYEQDGKGEQFSRPVIIFRKFNTQIFWGIPLTKNNKDGKFYFGFNLNKGLSTAILSQIKLLDSKRLLSKAGWINKNDFQILKEKFKKLIP